jgi:tight adherence protein C
LRRRAVARLYDDQRTAAAASARDTALQQWLARAGYRRADAVTVFVSSTAASAMAGLLLSQFYRVVLYEQFLQAVSSVPGTSADVMALILAAGPWILFGTAALLPTLIVRTVRRTRVSAIEQDLPLALELFATMGQAGLGFDAAVAKIVRAQGGDRPLSSELMNFQHDMLAGMSRTQALRQLSRRIDLPSLTSFTSALIQAENVGASMAETLQHQAVELRQRRRENALLQAQALPVKLVFPLVICFLPGIFVSTLAPVLFQVIQVADGVLRGAGR